MCVDDIACTQIKAEDKLHLKVDNTLVISP